MKNILIEYTSYNLWANKKLLEVLNNITPALLDQEIKSSFPTLKKTVCHIWGAEEIWLKRLSGAEQPSARGFTFSGETKEAFDAWLKTSVEFHSFVSAHDEGFFQTPCNYKDLKGNPYRNLPWQMIMHCMNHSTYHRGQIITMLREVGITAIPSTDMIGFFREINKS